MRGKGRKGETRRCAPVLANFAPSRARGLPRMKTRTRRKGTRPDLFSPDSPIFLALAIARLAKEKHTGSRLCTLVRRSEADCCHHRDPRPRGPHQCLNIRSWICIYRLVHSDAIVRVCFSPGNGPLFNFVRCTSSFSLPSLFLFQFRTRPFARIKPIARDRARTRRLIPSQTLALFFFPPEFSAPPPLSFNFTPPLLDER